MKYPKFSQLITSLIASLTACYLNAGPFDAIQLKSSKGSTVEVVAIHSLSPEGLTFSPKPSKPLIGSNQLQTITTDWSNIDISSLKQVPELKAAYQETEKGRTKHLQFGPHFHSISDSMIRIKKNLPRARYWVGGTLYTMGLEKLVQDHGQHRPNRWSILSDDKDRTLSIWRKEYQDLEAISYRSDIIRFRSTLDEAISSLEKISSEERAFDISAARSIAELLSTE